MTLQQYDDLHDEGNRLHPSVEEAMAEHHGEAGEDTTPWTVEYEIPAETNGWIYMGNPGALSTTHQWVDQYPDPTEAVVVHYTPTHPQDETPDFIEAKYHHDFEDSRGMVFFRKDGEPYRTPLHIKRRLFWEAVEAAIDYMEINPPG